MLDTLDPTATRTGEPPRTATRVPISNGVCLLCQALKKWLGALLLCCKGTFRQGATIWR